MSEFITHLNDVFKHFGPIHAKRMFGGYGIYHNDLMFALVADDVLYLKADAESAASFEQLGLTRFEYIRGGKITRMSYYTAPGEIFDDPDLAKAWAARAYEAASRSRKPQTKSRKK